MFNNSGELELFLSRLGVLPVGDGQFEPIRADDQSAPNSIETALASQLSTNPFAMGHAVGARGRRVAAERRGQLMSAQDAVLGKRANDVAARAEALATWIKEAPSYAEKLGPAAAARVGPAFGVEPYDAADLGLQQGEFSRGLVVGNDKTAAEAYKAMREGATAGSGSGSSKGEIKYTFATGNGVVEIKAGSAEEARTKAIEMGIDPNAMKPIQPTTTPPVAGNNAATPAPSNTPQSVQMSVQEEDAYNKAVAELTAQGAEVAEPTRGPNGKLQFVVTHNGKSFIGTVGQ